MVRKNAKALLAQALMSLLQHTPLDKIDIQDLAEAAGLSRQTFYYNFRNKRDLLCWMLEQDMEASVQAFHGNSNLNDYLLAALQTIQGKSVLYQSIHSSEARCQYLLYFEQGIINCALSVEENSRMGRMNDLLWDSLNFFVAGASGMICRWVENGLQQSAAQLANTLIRNMPPAIDRYLRCS